MLEVENMARISKSSREGYMVGAPTTEGKRGRKESILLRDYYYFRSFSFVFLDVSFRDNPSCGGFTVVGRVRRQLADNFAESLLRRQLCRQLAPTTLGG